jgi:2-iminobutanoate/2-iminopropanoate deaminase
MTSVKHYPTQYSYSSAVAAGSFIFLSLHRGFGETFTEQFHGTFTNIKATLGKFYLNFDSIVKVNVWLKNVQDLPEMEKLFAQYFEVDHYPARMTATTEFIDADCLLMIDAVVFRGE